MQHKVSDEVLGLAALEKKYSRAIKSAEKAARKERRAYFAAKAAKAAQDEENWMPGKHLSPYKRKRRAIRDAQDAEKLSREDRFCKTGGFKLTRENVMSCGKHIRVCGMRNKSLHELSWKF